MIYDFIYHIADSREESATGHWTEYGDVTAAFLDGWRQRA